MQLIGGGLDGSRFSSTCDFISRDTNVPDSPPQVQALPRNTSPVKGSSGASASPAACNLASYLSYFNIQPQSHSACQFGAFSWEELRGSLLLAFNVLLHHLIQHQTRIYSKAESPFPGPASIPPRHHGAPARYSTDGHLCVVAWLWTAASGYRYTCRSCRRRLLRRKQARALGPCVGRPATRAGTKAHCQHCHGCQVCMR